MPVPFGPHSHLCPLLTKKSQFMSVTSRVLRPAIARRLQAPGAMLVGKLTDFLGWQPNTAFATHLAEGNQPSLGTQGARMFCIVLCGSASMAKTRTAGPPRFCK